MKKLESYIMYVYFTLYAQRYHYIFMLVCSYELVPILQHNILYR